MVISRMSRIGFLLFFLWGNLIPAWSMNEEEYVKIAAETFQMMYETQHDGQPLDGLSRRLTEKFGDEKIREYMEMTRRMMDNEALAERVNKKIAQLLAQRGYKVWLDDRGNVREIRRD